VRDGNTSDNTVERGYHAMLRIRLRFAVGLEPCHERFPEFSNKQQRIGGEGGGDAIVNPKKKEQRELIVSHTTQNTAHPSMTFTRYLASSAKTERAAGLISPGVTALLLALPADGGPACFILPDLQNGKAVR